MSRCFPFPPPGYEKKPILDDTNLLTKEKPKEKKRKDKKDKEKSERKVKKDKESSEEKQKERKDRKEKHKDRKDKDRDKEKKRTSDEKKIVESPECNNGGKLDTTCLQNGETKDSKFLLELGKRIRDEGGARENEMVQKSVVTDQRKAELPRKVVENNIGNSEGKEKYKREDDKKANGQTDKVEARGMESAAVKNFTKMDQERVEGVAIPVDKDVKKQREGKKRSKHKDNDSRGDRNKDKEREKKKKSKDKDRDKERGMKEKTKEKESNKENPELRESGKDSLDIHNIKPSYLLKENNKSSTSDGNLGKRKEQVMNGFLHDGDTRPNKLSKPVSSSHQVVELGRKLEPCQTTLQFASEKPVASDNLMVESKVSCSHPALENGRKLELCQLPIHSASQMQGTANNHKNASQMQGAANNHKNASQMQGAANNHKKDNKETRISGLIEAQQPNVCSTRPLFVSIQPKAKVEASVRPPHHKVDNKVSSSHPVLENGRKLELHQLAIQSTSKLQGALNNHKKENKEPKINGSIEVQQPNVCSMRPLSAPVQAKSKVEASVKPPHPDSKYLSQILSVPKIESWTDFDDQEWLFSSDDLQLKKPKLDSSKVDGTPKVWAETLRMESADVTALPYVIPY